MLVMGGTDTVEDSDTVGPSVSSSTGVDWSFEQKTRVLWYWHRKIHINDVPCGGVAGPGLMSSDGNDESVTAPPLGCSSGSPLSTTTGGEEAARVPRISFNQS